MVVKQQLKEKYFKENYEEKVLCSEVEVCDIFVKTT